MNSLSGPSSSFLYDSAEFVDVSVKHSLFQSRGEMAEVFGVTAYAHDEIAVTFGVLHGVAEVVHGCAGDLYLNSSHSKVAVYQSTQSASYETF